ncbi:hypothetical protein STEG23_023003 [Scotinomys teguina]
MGKVVSRTPMLQTHGNGQAFSGLGELNLNNVNKYLYKPDFALNALCIHSSEGLRFTVLLFECISVSMDDDFECISVSMDDDFECISISMDDDFECISVSMDDDFE